MRDRYLFRGKRTDNGKWVYGGIIQTENWSAITVVNDYEGSMYEPPSCEVDDFDVIPETVGQYTGLLDKNGRRVFEGDIVNVNTNKENLCHRYEGKRLVIRFDEYHRFVASGRLEYPLCNHYEWEVIGNIHDNHELLKGE